MAIEESDAKAVLTLQREAKILQAHKDAWEDWWKSPDRSKFSFWKRTRANMFFERLRYHLYEAFKNDRGVHFQLKHQTFKILFDQKLIVRFKKANGKGLGSNVWTQEVFHFCSAQQEIPGLPGVDKVEVVYVLNPLNTTIEKVFVQARDGKVRLWAYEIGGNKQAGIVPLPQRIPPKLPAGAGDLVTPRKSGRRDESEDKKG